MVLSEIEKLLEKYDLGETSLSEEQQLKAYFSQGNVPAHLESYKVMFQYFDTTKEEMYIKAISIEPAGSKQKKSRIYQWISIAAVAVLMLGILIPNMMGDQPARTLAGLSQEERETYDKTKEALSMLSSNFNDAASSVGSLSLVSTNFNKGAEQVMHVKEFSKTTNRLVKKKQTPKNKN
ncbi:hypothetical protein [Sediminibacter sp. Hel_I_10]|uniref:hypothetical protein n=1 Tax=Sediminibacter sp. Hel_I_10 TaxID=1392490 RepID=UPI00047CF1E7|nr:hypothetical protein [Sediminibacter sp. Hel_I_10]